MDRILGVTGKWDLALDEETGETTSNEDFHLVFEFPEISFRFQVGRKCIMRFFCLVGKCCFSSFSSRPFED